MGTPTTSPLEHRIRLSLKETDIQQRMHKHLTHLAGTMRLDGFRPGRVPMKVVEKQLGHKARQEATQDVLSLAFSKTVEEMKLRPTGKLHFEPVTGENSTGQMEMDVVFEVYPKIELANMSALSVARPVVKVEDEDVSKTLETIRRHHATYEPVNRSSQMGDRLSVTIEELAETSKADKPATKDIDLVLSNEMQPQMREPLLGQQAGAKIEISTSEQNQLISVMVNKVCGPILPTDDELAHRLGLAEGGIVKLREMIHSSMEGDIARRVDMHVTRQLLDGLLAAHDIPVPPSMVESEMHQLQENARRDLASMGLPPNEEQLNFDHLRAMAERRVKLALLFSELCSVHHLNPNRNQINREVQRVLQGNPQAEELTRKIMKDEAEKQKFSILALERNVVEWLRKQAKIEERPMSVADLQKSEQPQHVKSWWRIAPAHE